jgi:hypothetical protein
VVPLFAEEKSYTDCLTGLLVASLERLQDGAHVWARDEPCHGCAQSGFVFSSCLVRTVWIESCDDTGDLQPRYLILAVPDPSGKVRNSFFDSPGTRLCGLAPRWALNWLGLLGSTFQHAVVRSINDKNAQLQKQLENLVREGTHFPAKRKPFFLKTCYLSLADGEIHLLNSKLSGDF